MTLKIVQLSDCHVAADPEEPYRGQDAGANLSHVWARAEQWEPHLVLLTGDVSEDASPASYQRVKDKLDDRKAILALPGNHDDPALMSRYFPSGPWDGPLVHEAGSWLIVLLDSSLEGRIEGGFSDAELGQLQNALESSPKPNILVALHHQPVPVQAPWIDRYALTRPEKFLAIIDAEPRVKCVVWGHIHHHFSAERNGVQYLGAPSTAANSLGRTAKFDLDPLGPSCRTLELDEAGKVVYGQLYSSAPEV
ncbi:MAG TPA: metallophosphoesterase [Xanthomonadales bacterium]|nr:metallophosphoesterase [Xanthomonadales bacterium]